MLVAKKSKIDFYKTCITMFAIVRNMWLELELGEEGSVFIFRCGVSEREGRWSPGFSRSSIPLEGGTSTSHS
jgi:hypothetical protein